MKTTVYLVRHGDVDNPDQILYERLSGFPLSDLGRQQAQKLAIFLSTKSISAVYASPLERTRETAGIIQSFHPHLTITYDERIIEVATPLRGKKMEELARDNWNFYKKEHVKAGGEKMSDIWKRMRHFMKEIVKKHAGEEIIVVSHGDPIMITALKHKNKPLIFRYLRGEEYVDTAKGFAFHIDKSGAAEVEKLDF